MDIREVASLTWAHLSSHKLRVVLTVVGVLVGVASVVAIVTMGDSVRSTVAREFRVFDANMMVTCVGVEREQGVWCERSNVFTQYDVDNIRQLDHVQGAAPLGLIPTASIVHDGEVKQYNTLVASGRELFPVIGAEVGQGRMYENGEMEVVIGSAVVEYFGEDNRIEVGDELTIVTQRGATYRVTVVGILEPTKLGQFRYGYDQAIYTPVDPFYNQRTVSPNTGIPMKVYAEVLVRAPSEQRVGPAQEEIKGYLQSDRSDARELKAESKDFVVITWQFILDVIHGQIGTFTMFITAVAGVSLISGGIGILNIMLVGAVERTREIGIMKAVGAKKRDILQLFGFEAGMLGLLGGLAGLGVGLVVSVFVVDFLSGATPYDVQLVVPWGWLPVALAVGAGIGLLAGLYPAWKAATVDPVEALRYE